MFIVPWATDTNRKPTNKQKPDTQTQNFRNFKRICKKAWICLDFSHRSKSGISVFGGGGGEFSVDCFPFKRVYLKMIHLLKNCCCYPFMFWGGGVLPVLLARTCGSFIDTWKFLFSLTYFFFPWKTLWKCSILIWNSSEWWKSVFSILPIISARPIFSPGKMALAMSSKSSPYSLKSF